MTVKIQMIKIYSVAEMEIQLPIKGTNNRARRETKMMSLSMAHSCTISRKSSLLIEHHF